MSEMAMKGESSSAAAEVALYFILFALQLLLLPTLLTFPDYLTL
jgi:hypothetical protein